MTTASQTGNALSFTYDALGRNLTQSSPLGTVTSTWDVAGRRTRLDIPGGFFWTYDYLYTGPMWAIREAGAASGPGVNSIGYDNLGRRANIQRGNGTVAYYDYDPVSRLQQLNQDFPGTTSDQVSTFSYSVASQIQSRLTSNDAYAMRQQYNASRGYEANGLNQYGKAGSVDPTYDRRGNLVTQGTSTYAYSAENMMTGATVNGATTGMSYDPAMRLYQIGGTRFLYDGTDLVAEYDGSGNALRRYVHGPGTDEVMVWYEGSDASSRRYLHADERGSVIAVSDGSGNALGIKAYDEWGTPQSTNLGRFGYTGQTWLPELGMWYYKARMYSPRLGRFMQSDPIVYGDGMNLYAYVGNDPVNMVDPSGRNGAINYDAQITVTAMQIVYLPIASAGVAAGGGMASDPGGSGGDGGEEPQKDDSKYIICQGPALVYAGNPRHVGRTGGMLRPIRPGAAAIIPRQWTGSRTAGPLLRSQGALVGGVTGGGQRFSGLDDTAGNTDLGSDPQQVLIDRADGGLYIELVTGQHEGASSVTLAIPKDGGLSCPAGTTQTGTR